MTDLRGAGVVALALAIAGCASSVGANADGGGGSGAGPPNTPCATSIALDPAMPVAGPAAVLHARAAVTDGFVPRSYTWHVQFDGAPIGGYQTSTDGSAIDIPVPQAGIYALGVDVTSCASASAVANVANPGARTQSMRLQIVSPLAAAVPPAERFYGVPGGADRDLGVIPVAQGGVFQVQVLGPAGGVPAYLQFSPLGAPDAVVEGFSDASGAAAVQLDPGLGFSVLVVPSSDQLAPRRIAGWQTSQVVQVDAGLTVAGSVGGPGCPGLDAPLAGATVRLVSDGVPSTVAVTAGDGSFALHVAPGASVTVEVTPPDGSGLPRLSATSTGFALTAPVVVCYSANLWPSGRPVDLAGAVVQRAGGRVAGAAVTVVGSLATAGMVTAGATVIGSGQLRVATTADATGALPTTLVPAGVLSAVIEVPPTGPAPTQQDLAVAPLDTTGVAPTTIDAPPMQLITTAVTAMVGADVTGLEGALIDLVPTGALALAGAPMLRLTTGAGGTLGRKLPSGGRYELRLRDPLGRGAPLVVADRAITAIASSYLLPAAIRLQGTLLRDGTVALPNASVQLMCSGCSGLDAVLPLSEVVSDAAGRFTLAVPDPGTR